MSNSNSLNVAVIGLGFIGLPLSLSYAMKGANVVGIDVVESHVNDINSGVSHHKEYYEGKSLQDILREQIKASRFRATTSYEDAAKDVDNYLMTVGIPVKNGDPIFDDFNSAATALAKVLKKGDTVILRSTVNPGTTEDLLLPILEEHSGLKAGEDFYLAYSSERIAEGRAFEEFISMPLAIGGINEASIEKAKRVLSLVTKAEITVSEIKVVETSKIIENIQRDVNIAMVQEFARFAERFGIDTFELIRVANTHSRVSLLVPGPGVGGYCLPNALYYLLPKAKELGLPLPLLETARRVNDEVPKLLVDLVADHLKKVGKEIGECKVAVLGLAMKDFSNDDRISPAHDIVLELLSRGATVAAFDPAVPTTYDYKVDNIIDSVNGADALIYTAVQEEFMELDWDTLVEKMSNAPVLLDTRNRIPKRIGEKVTLLRI